MIRVPPCGYVNELAERGQSLDGLFNSAALHHLGANVFLHRWPFKIICLLLCVFVEEILTFYVWRLLKVWNGLERVTEMNGNASKLVSPGIKA